VIGFGGYPSPPALIAAITRGRRTVIHEQNAVSGRANRLLVLHVTAIARALAELGRATARTPRARRGGGQSGSPGDPRLGR
jgi:UDP-N-acetylglucosamine--N-acetylmuramyl-(pentapeptide) pyrophosphoryl-undecaprenol N-acetylglucosamine transferase